MANRLTEVRSAAINVLKQKFQRVYSGRGLAPAQSQSPCVVVCVDSHRTEPETLDSSLTYRQTVRLITLICTQANISVSELTEEMLSVMQQAFVEYPDLGTDGLESLVPDLLNINLDNSGEAVTVCYQQGWQAVYFEQAI